MTISDHTYQLLISTLAAITATIGAVSARIAVTKIHEIHLSINSRWDQMRALIDTEAHARGITEGKQAGMITSDAHESAAAASAVLAAAHAKAEEVLATAKVTAAALIAAQTTPVVRSEGQVTVIGSPVTVTEKAGGT
jgi:hypothetical protein